MKNKILIILSFIVVSCQPHLTRHLNRLELLKDWLTGSFSSQEQARTDTNFYDIRLQICQIWPEAEDGYWLYVEQASSLSVDKPYRQRIYHLSCDQSQFKSTVYVIPQPQKYVGACHNTCLFSSLTPDSLSQKKGCTVFLEYKDNAFTGQTKGQHCLSCLRGAAYATSETRIQKDLQISWDRGFNEAGNQVWGSIAGPYIFRRIKK